MTTVFKAHCPRCDGERLCDIHGEIDIPWEWTDGEHSVHGQNTHKLVQCRGCETVFYQLSTWDSEEWEGRYNSKGEEETFYPVKVTTHPTPEKKGGKPDWVWTLYKADMQLAAIMDEMYGAHETDSLILASVGLRTALDHAIEILKIDPGHPLEAKVDKLLSEGIVGEAEAKTLHVVANAGNAAAHRGWSPEREEFQKLLTTLEQFIQLTIVSGETVLDIAPKIPPRHPRPPKSSTK